MARARGFVPAIHEGVVSLREGLRSAVSTPSVAFGTGILNQDDKVVCDSKTEVISLKVVP